MKKYTHHFIMLTDNGYEKIGKDAKKKLDEYVTEQKCRVHNLPLWFPSMTQDIKNIYCIKCIFVLIKLWILRRFNKNIREKY